MLVSDDFADEIDYMKLITITLIVASFYYEKGIFQQSNGLDPRKFSSSFSDMVYSWYF